MQNAQHPQTPTTAMEERRYVPRGRPLRVLQLIQQDPGVGPKHLAARLDVQTPLLGSVLTYLWRRGLVVRRVRGSYVVTGLGESALAAAAKANEQQEDPHQ